MSETAALVGSIAALVGAMAILMREIRELLPILKEGGLQKGPDSLGCGVREIRELSPVLKKNFFLMMVAKKAPNHRDACGIA
jgi:hypothetical protein